MEGEVSSLAFGGYGVVKTKGEIFFISGALPEEVVEFSIDFKRKGVNFGKAEKVLKPSPFRVEPKCEHFLICGGCHFQNLIYERQIKEKEKILKDSLKKIGKIEANFEKPIFSKEYGYRKKVQFEIDEDGDFCFHRRNSGKLLKVNCCPILSKPLELFLKRYKKLEKKIRDANNLALYLSKSIVGRISLRDGELRKIWRDLKKISLKGLWLRPKEGFGKYLIKRSFDGYFLYHSPFSFMQINEDVNKLLIEDILNILKDVDGLKVLDAYAGVGNFSLPLFLKFKDLTALEPSSSNFYLLRKNKEENNQNFLIFKEKFEDFKIDKRFDLILIDPPREGLSKKAIEKIKEMEPEFLIYISCDPSTFSRDLKLLLSKYSIKFIKLVDMFPQTYHIEALAFLKREICAGFKN